MPSERLSVVVTRRLPEPVENRLKDLFDVTLREDDTPMTRAELVEKRVSLFFFHSVRIIPK